MDKKTASSIGIAIGTVIIIIGLCLTGFGTESGKTTMDVIIDGIGLVIVAIGLFDIAYFIYKLAGADEDSMQYRYLATAIQNLKPSNYSHDAGGWTCTCGRKHVKQETSCICGVRKAEIEMKNKQNN